MDSQYMNYNCSNPTVTRTGSSSSSPVKSIGGDLEKMKQRGERSKSPRGSKLAEKDSVSTQVTRRNGLCGRRNLVPVPVLP